MNTYDMKNLSIRLGYDLSVKQCFLSKHELTAVRITNFTEGLRK